MNSSIKKNSRIFHSKTKNIFFNFSFDKGRLKSLVLWFLKNYGQERTIELLEHLKEIGFDYATKAGISLGIDDLKIPPEKISLLAQAQNKIDQGQIQYKRGEITGIERFQRLIDTWHETSENLKQEVIRHFEATDILNPVYMMAFSGARGNISQVRQLVGMRGLMADPQGKILDFPIRSNFREGLTLTEYIISTYGARKGIVDTALRTANAGYLTRRLVDVAQHVIVAEFDCATKNGIFVFDMKEGNKTIYSFQNRLVGRVLAQDIENKETEHNKFISNKKIAYKNQEISYDLALSISKLTKKAFIRSPLTCQTKKLICQLCYGWSLSNGKLVSIGEAVGIIAAQSIGEPGTQLTMRTFHTGGVFSGGLSEQIIAQYDGIVNYFHPIPGLCIRTPQGQIAFLTKTEGTIGIQKQNNEKKENLKDLNGSISTMPIHMQYSNFQFIKIPSYTVLFVRNKQEVFKKQIIGQLSSISHQKNQRSDAEQTIYSEFEGEIYNSHIDVIEKRTPFNDISFEAWGWGYLWILAGKIYQAPINSYIFSNPGDFINKNTILNRINWTLPENCLIENHSFLRNDQSILLKRSFKSFLTDTFFSPSKIHENSEKEKQQRNRRNSNFSNYQFYFSFNKKKNKIIYSLSKNKQLFSTNFNLIKLFSKLNIQNKFKINLRNKLVLNFKKNLIKTNLILNSKSKINSDRLVKLKFESPYSSTKGNSFSTIKFYKNLNQRYELKRFNRNFAFIPASKKYLKMFLIKNSNSLIQNVYSKYPFQKLIKRNFLKYFTESIFLNKRKPSFIISYLKKKNNKIENNIKIRKKLYQKSNYFNKWTLINLIHQTSNQKAIKTQIKNYYSNSSYFQRNLKTPFFPVKIENLPKNINKKRKLEINSKKKTSLISISSMQSYRFFKDYSNFRKILHTNKIHNLNKIFYKKEEKAIQSSNLIFKKPLLWLNINNLKYKKLSYSFSVKINKLENLNSKYTIEDQFFTLTALKTKKLDFKNTYNWSPISSLFLKWFSSNFQTQTNGIFYFPKFNFEKPKTFFMKKNCFFAPKETKEKFSENFSFFLTKNNQFFINYYQFSMSYYFLKKKQYDKFKKLDVSKTFNKQKIIPAFTKQIIIRPINLYKKHLNIIKIVGINSLFKWKSEFLSSKQIDAFPSSKQGRIFPFYLFNNKKFYSQNRVLFFKNTSFTSNEFNKKNKKSNFIILRPLSSFINKQIFLLKYFSNKFRWKNVFSTKKEKFGSKLKIKKISNRPLTHKISHSINSKVFQNPFSKLSANLNQISWIPQEDYKLYSWQQINFLSNSKNSKFIHNKKNPLFYSKNRQGYEKKIYSKLNGILILNNSNLKNVSFCAKQQIGIFRHSSEQVKPSNSALTLNRKNIVQTTKKNSQDLKELIYLQFLNWLKFRWKNNNTFKQGLFLKVNSIKNELDFRSSKAVLNSRNIFRNECLLNQKGKQKTFFSSLFLKEKNYLLKTKNSFFYSKKQKSILVNSNSLNILFSKKPLLFDMKQFQNLSLKQGWVYLSKNVSKFRNFHESFFNAGNCIFDNIFFEQNDVYLSCIFFDCSNLNIFELNNKIVLNRVIKSSNNNQKKREEKYFKIKLKIKNINSRYFSWNDELKLPLSNFNNKFKSSSSTLLSFKKVNTKSSVKQRKSLTFSGEEIKPFLFIRPIYNLFLPNFHSFKKKIFKINNRNEVFSKQLLLNFYLSILNKQESYSKLISNFPNVDLKILSDFFLPKLNNRKNLNHLFENRMALKIHSGKKMQGKFKELKIKKQNRLKNFVAKQAKQQFFYFAFNLNFFPLKIEFSIPTLYAYYFKESKTNFNSFKNISLDFLLSNQNCVNSINQETEILNFLILKNQLLFNKINSLNNNQISSFSIKLKENYSLLSSMRQLYSSSCFDFALLTKMAYFANQKLFARDFMNLAWDKNERKKNSYKNTWLKTKQVDSFNSFPFFKNQFILSSNHKNVFLSTKPFATTSFLSPLEGEMIENSQNMWSANIGQHSYLLITKKELFSLSLNYSIENNQHLFFYDKSFNSEERSINFNKNYNNKEKIQFFKNEKYSDYQNIINSIFISNQHFLKIEKILKSVQMMTDKQSIETIIYYNHKFYKIKGLQIANVESYRLLRLSAFLVYGDKITLERATDQEGQIIHMNSSKVTLRYAQPISASPKGILHSYNGDFISKNSAVITLPFQTLKTGDIVQGIPKVEQYFEARTTKEGRVFRDSLPNLLQGIFESSLTLLPLEDAVRQSFLKIQQIIVNGVQRVYRSQGVSIADKHLEIIVRQMTSKVQVVHGGQTGFFPGELIDLELIEGVNQFLLNKINYEPVILGITRASLEVDSFLSAASFQQTTKMLSKSAIYKKKDFLKGLKENIIVGNLIPGGTGYLVYLQDLEVQSKLKSFPSSN